MKFSNKALLLCFVLVFFAFSGELLFGQVIDISALKDKGTLTPADKQKIEQWVDNQLNNLSSVITKPLSSNYSASKRQRSVAGIIKNIVNASKGGRAFRNVLLDSLGKRVLADVDSVDIKVAAREVVLLVELADVSFVDEFLSLLKADDAGIKCLAICGLETLKGKLSADRKALIVEKVSQIDGGDRQEVLTGQKYMLLADMDNKAGFSVLVSSLKKRAAEYVKGGSGRFDADRALVEAIGRIVNKLDSANKKQVSDSLVEMLKVATGLIVGGKIPLADVRGRTEMLIYSIEETLSGITGKNKNLPVISALKQVDYKKAEQAISLWAK